LSYASHISHISNKEFPELLQTLLCCFTDLKRRTIPRRTDRNMPHPTGVFQMQVMIEITLAKLSITVSGKRLRGLATQTTAVQDRIEAV